MGIKILLDPTAGAGAFALPSPTAAPGETVSVISSGDAPAAAPAPAPQAAPVAPPTIPQGNNAVPPTTPSEHNVVIQSENPDQWDPWSTVAKPPTPAEAQQPQAPQAPPAQAPATGDESVVSPDGKWINISKPNPRSGQMEIYTRIPNTPESVSNYVQNQLLYIDQLRNTPPPQQQQFVQPQAPQQPAPQPGMTDAEIAELSRLASEEFGEDYEVGPLAKFGAKLLALSEQKIQKQAQQQAFVQRQVAEYQAVKNEDPNFDLGVYPSGQPVNPLARQIMMDNPSLGAREVYAIYDHWVRRYERQQQAAQAPAAAPTASAPQPQVIMAPMTPDPRLYQQPSGSGGAPAMTTDTPYVQAVVQSYYKMMREKATPQGAAMARNDAIALERAGGNQG